MALAVLGMARTVSAASITVATFQDPSNTISNPLFTFAQGTGTTANAAGSTLSGSWSSTGLTLHGPGDTDFSNVTFDIGTLVATGGVADGPGGSADQVNFGSGGFTFYQGVTPLLQYAFSSAALTNTNFGASTLELDGVAITVPVGSPLVGWTFFDPQSFAFSFANPSATLFTTLNGGANSTWTSAFTSSADARSPVPEPASMLLLGTGLVGIGSAVRRRLARKS